MSHLEQPGKGPCRRLRNKGMFFEPGPGSEAVPIDDGIYWCSRTMTCLGPDSKPATREDCGSGRGCFEHH